MDTAYAAGADAVDDLSTPNGAEVEVATDCVVTVQPPEQVEAGFALVVPGAAAPQRSRSQVALNDSASALGALLRTALLLWSTPAVRQTAAHAQLVYRASRSRGHERVGAAAATPLSRGRSAGDASDSAWGGRSPSRSAA